MLLRLQSDQADLVFALLTEPWVTGRNRDTENLFAKAWNFRGEPFEVDGVRYTFKIKTVFFRFPSVVILAMILCACWKVWASTPLVPE